MRDKVTHFSNLKEFKCFVEQPYLGEKKSTIYYPTMPDGTRATEYFSDVWNKLLKFYQSFLLMVLNWHTLLHTSHLNKLDLVRESRE